VHYAAYRARYVPPFREFRCQTELTLLGEAGRLEDAGRICPMRIHRSHFGLAGRI
jgi:hypothetical protein